MEGAAHRSYGLNVARLADLPPEILVQAKAKSRELEDAIHARSTQPPTLTPQESARASLFKDLLRMLSQDGSRVERQVLLELQKLLTGRKTN